MSLNAIILTKFSNHLYNAVIVYHYALLAPANIRAHIGSGGDIAIIVVVMVFMSIKNLLTKEKKNQDVSVKTTYFSVMENNKWGVIDNLRTIYNKT